MYRQITVDERYTLGVLRQLGYSGATIGRALGRHRSTVWREVRRNATHHDGTYRPQLAHWYATSRRSRSRRNQHFTAADFQLVRRYLERQWSPEQIAGRLRLERLTSCPSAAGACGAAAHSEEEHSSRGCAALTPQSAARAG